MIGGGLTVEVVNVNLPSLIGLMEYWLVSVSHLSKLARMQERRKNSIYHSGLSIELLNAAGPDCRNKTEKSS